MADYNIDSIYHLVCKICHTIDVVLATVYVTVMDAKTLHTAQHFAWLAVASVALVLPILPYIHHLHI